MSEIKYGFFREDKEAEPGFSKELISMDFKEFGTKTTMDELNIWPHEGVDTLIKGLERLEKQMPAHPLFGTKVSDGKDGFKYEWITIKEAMDTAKLLAAGFEAMGFIPDIEAEDMTWKFLGILSKNRKEWYLTHIANMMNKTTTVAFYDTLGPSAARFMCDQTELTTIACSSDLVEKICKMKEGDEDGKMARVVNLISYESDIKKEVLELADQHGIKVTTFDEILAKGKSNTEWKAAVITKDDHCAFSYTSGTTGDPKGVKLTHQMLVQCAASLNARLAKQGMLCEKDTYISYLPSAHSFEQALFSVVCCYGMKCGFFGGDPLKLIKEDLPALKPTFFPSVPRVYNKIFGILNGKINEMTGFKHNMIKGMVKSKLEKYRATGVVTHCLYDMIVFKKFKAVVGGNVRFMVTGSAPIASDVLDFLKIAFCCPIIEGYGMTETSAGSVTTTFGDPKSGHVGGPLANVKIRLRDIPEMEYLSSSNPPKGEICMWGPSIMKGYFKNPEKTAEALQDGWMASGDVGVINPNGSIQIVDRAKNIFKLSQGEYIAPEKLENIYIQSPWLAQVWIHGDSLHDFILIFAVLEPTELEKFVKENNIDDKIANSDDILNDTKLQELVYADILKLVGENSLSSLEKPKNMMLQRDMWTVENDMVTPTFKLKRNIAKKKYQEQIDKMYEEGMKFGVSKKA